MSRFRTGVKKGFFCACLLFYCSILLKFNVEYDSEYDQSNKKKIQPLTLQMVLPIPPIYCKDYRAEKVKKRKAVLTISLFDALWYMEADFASSI